MMDIVQAAAGRSRRDWRSISALIGASTAIGKRSLRTAAKALRIRPRAATALVFASLALTPGSALADQGGISFWLPGLFGSLAAVPGQPGLSFTTLYYHTSVDAGGSKSFVIGGRVVAGLEGRGNITAFGPTYVFATPVLGGQASVSLLGLAGRNQATISATLTGPLGNSVSGSRSQGLTAVGDLLPQAMIKWNQGVNNFMIYGTGDIPVGAYDEMRLANLGLGHGAIDGGGGYTYFDPKSGNEFSASAGFTYNFENTALHYQNGVDFHLDLGASHFVTKQVQIGVVGYFYQQVTGDSGSGAVLGDFMSRVAGVGPQIGFLFPVGDLQGYLNLKGYKEFAAEHRPEGWNTWVTFQISPAAKPAAEAKPVVSKY